jgi:hypothetical protein
MARKSQLDTTFESDRGSQTVFSLVDANHFPFTADAPVMRQSSPGIAALWTRIVQAIPNLGVRSTACAFQHCKIKDYAHRRTDDCFANGVCQMSAAKEGNRGFLLGIVDLRAHTFFIRHLPR